MRRAALVAVAALVALAVPAQTAPGPTCDAECAIDANAFGYQLPVTHLQSGAVVTWRSLDSVHVTLDGSGFGDEEACFVAIHNRLEPSTPIRFDIVAGALTATALTGDAEVPLACVTASPLPDGSFVLPYYCDLHPTMRGLLIVS